MGQVVRGPVTSGSDDDDVTVMSTHGSVGGGTRGKVNTIPTKVNTIPTLTRDTEKHIMSK